MKTWLIWVLTFLSLLATPAFGAGVFRTDNIVVGGTTPYYSGATLFVKGTGNTTGTTPFAINNSDGKTLIKSDGTGIPFIWFTSSVSLWMVGNELYTNKSDGTSVHLNP